MATQPALALVSELEAQINKLKLDLPSKIGITLVIKKLKEEIAKPMSVESAVSALKVLHQRIERGDLKSTPKELEVFVKAIKTVTDDF